MRRINAALLIFALLAPFGARAATPVIDPSGGFTQTATAVNTKTIAVTTTDANDVIVVIVLSGSTSTSSPTVSSISGCSLTWASRYVSGSFTVGTNQFSDLEEWWAFSAATQSACTVTVNYSKSVDTSAIVAFGVNGAHSSTAPFDTNVGLAKPTNCGSVACSAKVTPIATTQSHDFLIGAWGEYASGASGYNDCTNYTRIAKASNLGGSHFSVLITSGQGVSSTQSDSTGDYYVSSTPSACNAGTPVSQSAWQMFVDAITGDAPPATGGKMMLKSGPGW